MKKIYNKKIAIISIVMIFGVSFYFIGDKVFAAVTAVDNTAPAGVLVTLTVDEGISITPGADVTMAPNISVSANSSIGASSWNVKTNSHAGYTLAIKANASPALVNLTGQSFADYTEAAGVCSNPAQTTRATCIALPAIWTPTPETWSVESGTYQFGYSAYGTDTLDATWGNADTCGTGGAPGTNKYVGTQIADNTIATRALPTTPAGIITNICFAAQQNNTVPNSGTDVYAPSGTYTTIITATATTL